MIAILRQPKFARLWVGSLISIMGDWVLNVGLPIYIYVLTRSVLALGLVLLSISIPSILLGSVAGTLVDRWDRKRTLVWTNALLALGLLPLFLVRTADHVWIVYAVGAFESTLQQFALPAQNALIPNLVDAEHLVPANALIALNNNLARLIGPALGGLIAAMTGLNGIILADAISFLVAAMLIAGIALPHVKAHMPQVPHAHEHVPRLRIRRDLTDGMRVIISDRTLTVLLAMSAVVMLGEGVFGTLYAVYVYQVLHGGAFEIGQLMSAQAIGGLAGGVVIGWLGKRMLSRWAIGVSMALFGSLDLAIFNIAMLYPLTLRLLGAAGQPVSATHLFWPTAGLFVAVGVPGVATLTGIQSRLQAASPEGYRGRIFGALGALTGLFRLIGVITAGVATAQWRVVTVLNVQGVAYILAGVIGITCLPQLAARKDAAVPMLSASESIHAGP